MARTREETAVTQRSGPAFGAALEPANDRPLVQKFRNLFSNVAGPTEGDSRLTQEYAYLSLRKPGTPRGHTGKRKYIVPTFICYVESSSERHTGIAGYRLDS